MIPTIDEYWEEEGEETGEEDASLDEDDLFNDNSNEESEDGGHGKKVLWKWSMRRVMLTSMVNMNAVTMKTNTRVV